ncbi:MULTISPECIES: amidase [Streptomyces]|uniref:amidase n=1 Tax=Streptomyces lycopersici TaxID=2974589 RepID=UPI0021CE987B|nr:amidase [Streptomyces sp. NEAU-383]
MTLAPLSLDAVRRAAENAGLTMDDDELRMMLTLGQGALRACERLDEVSGHQPPVRYPRAGSQRPDAEDNPLNAWAVRCDVRGAATGRLAGRTVALKDMIPVAGVPMGGGSQLLRGHTPSYDATIVTRVLDAGGRITGIGTTEDLCLSGASVSSADGFVRNPWDTSRSAGGSSSGVAALVASGACDLGIGADQGGSIRIPAAQCGIHGLKPTYGLVPYTGCLPIDPSVDHVGPMARTARDLAALLEVIAGFDGGLDPRQRSRTTVPAYGEMLGDSLRGLRVGVLAEGFTADEAQSAVDETVRARVALLASLGAEIVDVSAPLHSYAMDIHSSVLLQGGAQFMLKGNAIGLPGKGFYDAEVALAAARGRALHSDLLFASVKYAAAVGGYLWDVYGGHYYAKAQNLAIRLRQQYDQLLEDVDVLVLPTVRTTAPPLPDADASVVELTELALDPGLIANTCAFNHTGHPALNVPAGLVDGLPVGMMLAGRHGDDGTLIRAAHALELNHGLADVPPGRAADGADAPLART